nr:zinc finger protein 513-like [Penaeus vannamei]
MPRFWATCGHKVLPGRDPQTVARRGPAVFVTNLNSSITTRQPQSSFSIHAENTQNLQMPMPLQGMHFECPHCSFATTSSGHLKIHIRSHSKSPYECMYCSYKTTQKSIMNRHLQIHTGEKPFACSLCPYRCNLKGNLKIHLERHKRMGQMESDK